MPLRAVGLLIVGSEGTGVDTIGVRTTGMCTTGMRDGRLCTVGMRDGGSGGTHRRTRRPGPARLSVPQPCQAGLASGAGGARRPTCRQHGQGAGRW